MPNHLDQQLPLETDEIEVTEIISRLEVLENQLKELINAQKNIIEKIGEIESNIEQIVESLES